jgi:uncharacterized membrane protein
MAGIADRADGRTLGRVTRGVLIFIGVSPFIPHLVEGVPVLGSIGAALDAWFSFQCQRDPARTLHFLGRLLPVCARCLGIYLGLGLGAVLLRPRLGVWPLRIWVGVAALVMLLDVWTEALGMRPPSAPLRLFTGLLLSYPVGAALVWSARELWPARGERG